MKLFFRELGGKGQPLIILHGLFGSSDNWLTQAKMLADRFHIYLLDQRNHGQSPHDEKFDLSSLADDIHEFVINNTVNAPIIIGHSMGGKAAMQFALTYPELVDRLIVVDIAPRETPLDNAHILKGLNAIPVQSLQSRNEADEILSKYVDELSVRQFLLKNLQRHPANGFSWKINLPVLEAKCQNIAKPLPANKTFDKPTLFIRGAHSNYIQDNDFDQIESIFPQSKIVTLDTGHWVQAEKPKEFVAEVIKFLS